MNVGTIVDTEKLAVRIRGRGAPLGEIEEDFAATLTPGDSFLIGGETVRYESLREMTVEVTRQPSTSPKVAVFMGTKLATSTLLSHRVIALLADPAAWTSLPEHTRDWLALQAEVSRLPRPGHLLAETFPRGPLEHLCLYGFAGRNAHQTLGLLVTRRMETAGLNPLGFVANDYALLIWGLDAVSDPAALLTPETLRDDLEGWLGGERGDEAHLPHRRHRRRPDRAPDARACARPAARPPSPPTSSTTPCAATTPATCCSASPARRPAAASSTSAASRRCSPAAAAASRSSAPRTSPRSPRRCSSRPAASRSPAAPRPASSPRPPRALLAEAGLT